MKKIKKQIFKNEIITEIITKQKPKIGSDTSCYILDKNTVIKLFNEICNPYEKLFLPHEIYGNNTYYFTSSIILNEENKIIGYTMPYIKGKLLNPKNFNNLNIQDLINFFYILEIDTFNISIQGIYTYDNFISNIILSDTGFKCIDSIDFQLSNLEPGILYYKNLRIFLNNIWDYLLPNEIKILFQKLNFKEFDFHESPCSIFRELYERSMNITNNELQTVNDFKKLIKTR